MNFTPALQWLSLAEEIAGPYGIEPLVILAIIWLESRGDPEAFNAVTDSTGLMQVVAREAGVPFQNRPSIADLKDPRTNIEWGCKVLAFALRQSNGDLGGALYRYSGGSHWPSYRDFQHKYWRPFCTTKRLLKRRIQMRSKNHV